MKIRKKAEQTYFIVNRYHYKLLELVNLCKKGYIVCYVAEWHHNGYNYKEIRSPYDIDDTDIFKIKATNCKTVKVVYNSLYGFYENVVETKDGTQISILL